jgi:hypothetical protein
MTPRYNRLLTSEKLKKSKMYARSLFPPGYRHYTPYHVPQNIINNNHDEIIGRGSAMYRLATHPNTTENLRKRILYYTDNNYYYGGTRRRKTGKKSRKHRRTHRYH